MPPYWYLYSLSSLYTVLLHRVYSLCWKISLTEKITASCFQDCYSADLIRSGSKCKEAFLGLLINSFCICICIELQWKTSHSLQPSSLASLSPISTHTLLQNATGRRGASEIIQPVSFYTAVVGIDKCLCKPT